MKKILLVLAAVLFISSVAAQAQNAIDKEGRKQGHWVKTDKDGSKIYEGDFIDGIETGTFTYFYPNGTVRITNVFEGTTQRCSHKAYDEKGHLIATGFYNKRNRDGEWLFYTEEGKLIKKAHYRMGVREGEQVIFNADGDTAEVSNWADNHRHGRWWKRIGKQGYITGTFVHGGLEGEVKEYDDNASLVSHGQYSKGLRNGFYRYYEDGELSVDEKWSQDILVSRKIRIMTPQAQMIDITTIACLMPKGKKGVLLFTTEGKSIDTYEPADNLYYRLGNRDFFVANKNQRVMVNNSCVVGIETNAEGGKELKLDPNPPFTIYPDEDCIKAVESVLREGLDGLE